MKVTTDGCLFGAWVAERIKNEQLVINNCLDIGTGTGLLSLMLAQSGYTTIDAVEIDKDTFQQASENIASSPWAESIKVIQADARQFKTEKKYDVIISNPPFYEKELKGNDIKKNIAHHNDGLLLPDLLDIIKKKLNPEGNFFLLLPYKRNEEIKTLFTKNELFIHKLAFVKQTDNHDYFRIMLAGKLKCGEQTETIIDEVSIKDDAGQYTAAFVHLLKGYYLHL